jgi:hypothetical protein
VVDGALLALLAQQGFQRLGFEHLPHRGVGAMAGAMPYAGERRRVRVAIRRRGGPLERRNDLGQRHLVWGTAEEMPAVRAADAPHQP